tara:strand:+ start:1996 stop:3291 length:1296 start_codon:yes stop_codon:yes gene_type:complete
MDSIYEKAQSLREGKKRGLWDNIHAKRKRGERPAKPGEKDYPKTLNVEAKVDERLPDYKRATARDKRYGNPHGSHELGGGIRKDRRADHEDRRGKKTKTFEDFVSEKRGLWDNIHAKRKRGERPAKPGDKDYPKTLNVEGLTGDRALRARQMQDSDIKKGGGKRTDADRDTAFRLGTGTSEDRVSQKKRKGVSAQGKGNAAKRRMNEEEVMEQMSREKFDTMSGKPSSALSRGGETSTIQKKINKARIDANAAGARGTEFVKPAKLQQTVNKAATMRFNSYEPEGEMVEGKGYQPEIEHSKLGDAKKKKDKERESKLPPHLQGDAIGKARKAFAHTNTYEACSWRDELEFVQEGSAAWQRKEGKNKSGGLNEKGRKSYERENPGSDLKAPQPEGGPRKRSFCARMGGVKGPMKKPNGEPTRKALALRKWKC